MNHLDQLEAQSVFIIREAFRHFKNLAMLWSIGKDSNVMLHLVRKAFVGHVPFPLVYIDTTYDMPELLRFLRAGTRRCLVFCDDLSFEREDADYKALKSVLDGGIEGRPANVLFYATSNRRHLMSRDMIENERSTAIHGSEAIEEKVSLSDRFGLWIGFHNANQDTFFAMIEGYAKHYGLAVSVADLHAQAVEWSVTRGSRSGRVAWQFIQDLAGRMGVKIEG